MKGGQEQVDQAIQDATTAWTRQHARVPTTAAAPSDRPDPMAGRKLPPTPPSWWGGEQDATRSSLLAAQALRRGSAPSPPKQNSVTELEDQLGIGTHDDIQAELDQIDGS